MVEQAPWELGEPSSYSSYDDPLVPLLYLLQEEARVLEACPSPAPPGKDSSVGAVGGLCSDDKLGCQAVDLR